MSLSDDDDPGKRKPKFFKNILVTSVIDDCGVLFRGPVKYWINRFRKHSFMGRCSMYRPDVVDQTRSKFT